MNDFMPTLEGVTHSINSSGGIVPIVQYEDETEMIHTDENPECKDPTCPCYETNENPTD